MAMVIPNEGELALLSDVLAIGGAAGATTLEAWSLRLFTNTITPGETDTAASYTEATYTGYAAKPLVRDGLTGHWSAPASGAPTGAWSAETAVAESVYATQTFVATAGSQSIRGYFIVGATSGKLIGAENFASPQVIDIANPVSFAPRFGSS